jgi:hypothetical protein
MVPPGCDFEPAMALQQPHLVTAMLGLLEAYRVELAWFGRTGRAMGRGGWMCASSTGLPGRGLASRWLPGMTEVCEGGRRVIRALRRGA